MTETWKDVNGYEGAYQVSNLGNVRSLHWRGTDEVRIMGQRKKNTGYFNVLLSKNGVARYALVHRLVAEAFIPNENCYATVNHIDENIENNNVENLEWCSLVDNIHKYCENHGMKYGDNRIKVPRKRRLNSNVLQMDKSGNVLKIWDCIAEVHNAENYNAWSISQCCDNKRKTAYGYKWQYAV